MPKFIITEKKDFHSKREGQLVEAENLSDAKRLAVDCQMFQETFLTIESETGEFLSWKPVKKAWSDESKPTE